MIANSAGHLLSIDIAYFIATCLFVVGLRRMSSPTKARSSIWIAGVGMAIAIIATLTIAGDPGRRVLIPIAMFLGAGFAFVQSRRVSMTDAPALIALYNGLGGGAAAGIAFVELLRASEHSSSLRFFAVVGALAGSVAFAGSLMAWRKLRSDIRRSIPFPNRQVVYLAIMTLLLLVGLILAYSNSAHPVLLLLFVLLALFFGISMTLPIAAADLPVLISLYNALTGLAVGFEGFVLGNPAMMVAGTLVFAAGTLLTQLMARAVNRRLSEIMYSGFGVGDDDKPMVGTRDGFVNEVEAHDAAASMAFANRVIVVPGYGMAIAQAQHKLRELTQLLDERGVQTAFAIHPVAGRMPGHMNVLLADAGVPYEKIADLSAINEEFSHADVALVIGANDTVNPSARTDEKSPLFGMPVLNVDQAGSVIVLKRAKGRGYANVANPLFEEPGTRVLLGDAKDSLQELITSIKALD